MSIERLVACVVLAGALIGSPAEAQRLRVTRELTASRQSAGARDSPLREERWLNAISPDDSQANRMSAQAEASLALLPTDAQLQALAGSLRGSASLASLRMIELRLRRDQLLRQALLLAEQALSLVPSHAVASFVRARAMDQLAAPLESVVSAYREALERLDREDIERRTDALFALGVVLTRLERNAEARAAYEELVRHPVAPGRGVALCNLAEIAMYLRDVDASLLRYEECARLLPQRATAWWGLAVAHDRVGHDADARAAADRAVAIDAQLEDITGEGVFYVPPYERYYYLAVGREAQARAQGSNQPLLAALAAWRSYAQEGGPQAPWIERIAPHIAAVERTLATSTAPPSARTSRPAR